MDTIVIGTGMPFTLAFLDQSIDEVVALWQSWVDSGETVRARHENPGRDAVVLLRPATMGVVEFVANEPGGRVFGDRMLWSLPSLLVRADAADLPPEQGHYWTVNMVGFSAETAKFPDGTVGLVLGNWGFGRI